jgi:hypothetical protein
LPGQGGQLLLTHAGGGEGRRLAVQRREAILQAGAPVPEFLERERARGVGVDQPLDLTTQLRLPPLERLALGGLRAIG